MGKFSVGGYSSLLEVGQAHPSCAPMWTGRKGCLLGSPELHRPHKSQLTVLSGGHQRLSSRCSILGPHAHGCALHRRRGHMRSWWFKHHGKILANYVQSMHTSMSNNTSMKYEQNMSKDGGACSQSLRKMCAHLEKKFVGGPQC